MLSDAPAVSDSGASVEKIQVLPIGSNFAITIYQFLFSLLESGNFMIDFIVKLEGHFVVSFPVAGARVTQCSPPLRRRLTILSLF